MNRQPLHPNESWENDPVWKLLDQAPSASAGPRFVNDTARAARLTIQAQPWWVLLIAPAPLAGLATATAALVFAMIMLLDSAPQPAMTNTMTNAMLDAKQAAAIQDIADSETLIAAVDHLDEFSDTELVSLIGF